MIESSDAEIDPMTAVLHDVRLRDTFFTRCALTAPWGLEIPRWVGASFHFVLDGECVLRSEEGPVALGRGDLVLLPHGRGHRLMDREGSPVTSVHEIPQRTLGKNASTMEYGGGGTGARLVCGGVAFEPHPLLEHLPEVLRVNVGDRAAPSWIEPMLTAMAEEADRPGPGGETVMTRLADVVVVGAVRTWLTDHDQTHRGWLGALRDPQIGRAMALIHHAAERPWSVASLASAVHMSRASFAERFTLLVGSSPMQYVTERRMHLATGWIRDERMSVSAVAERLGYGSDAAFSRAFKRTVGVPPGALRRASAH